MSIDWEQYQPYEPPYPGLLHELKPSEAKASFDHLMAARRERREQLRRLLESDGVILGTTDEDLQALNAWLDRSVERNPDDDARLANRWYAVVNDVALFLGDVVIERSPGLKWELFTRGKKDVAYQKHVIVGFTKASNPKYNLDIDRLVAGHAERVAAGLPVRENDFTTIVDAAVAGA